MVGNTVHAVIVWTIKQTQNRVANMRHTAATLDIPPPLLVRCDSHSELTNVNRLSYASDALSLTLGRGDGYIRQNEGTFC